MTTFLAQYKRIAPTPQGSANSYCDEVEADTAHEASILAVKQGRAGYRLILLKPADEDHMINHNED